MSAVEHLLKEFGARIGLPQMELNADRVCRVSFDEHMVVDLEAPEGDELLNVIGTVGTLPADASAELLTELLEGNIPTSDPHVPWTAIDMDSREILLCISLSPIPQVDDFETIFNRFLDHLDEWQGKIASAAHHTTAGTMSTGGAFPIDPRFGGVRV